MHYTAENSLLLQNFQIFYYELLRQKEKALRTMLPTEPSVEETTGQEMVEQIQQKLKSLIEELMQKTSKSLGGSSKATLLRDAEYIMAVLADEIFLNLQWIGAKRWQFFLLEAQLFQTQIAGELFFKKIDTLLEAHDPARGEIALLYFLALGLGFKGRFSSISDDSKLKWYKDQLYLLINHKMPQLYHPGRDQLITQCYDYDLSDPPGRGLPDVRVWSVCIGGILTAYFLVTYVVWYKMASEIYDVLSLIFEQTRQIPLI